LTSPDYYGNVADLQTIASLCRAQKKPLVIDGAHGGHLHGNSKLYAGAYADMWVDGVHKSLPALTQGAVVSAKKTFAKLLQKAVDIFRTTSPSYPIMASVEYAVKYPRNAGLEKRALALQTHERVYKNDDWTKLCAVFGGRAFEVEKRLESEGCYIEFCDGNTVTFYLSPATSNEEFTWLENRLLQLFEEFPLESENMIQRDHAPLILTKRDTEWVDLEKAQGRICAGLCGLFPPCTPLFKIGESIEKEKLERLQKASNVFGLKDGKILTFKEEE
jgi:lysine decarboxylase